MKKLLQAIIFTLLSLTLVGAYANGKGTAEDAQAMVKKAETYLSKQGLEKFLQEVSNEHGAFRDRDLYLSVYDEKGVVLAHGFNPKLVGKDVSTLVDTDQKPFMREILTQANGKGSGKVDYKWPSPENKAVYQEKTAFFKKVGNAIISCGAYK